MNNFDFAIVTTSLQGAILAGALAANHRKNVIVFLDNSIPHRLAREICCSFICATRPETVELLENARNEAVPFLARIGGAHATGKLSPLVLGHAKHATDALAHMYHTCRGGDLSIERLAGADFPKAGAAYRVRGARGMPTFVLWPRVLEFLQKYRVHITSPDQLQFSHHRDGSSTITCARGRFSAGRVVLADEASIAAYASQGDRQRLLGTRNMTSLIAACSPETGEQLIQSVDRSFIMRRKSDGLLEILAHVNESGLAAEILRNLPASPGLRRLAQTQFVSHYSADGAPITGKLGRSAFWGFAGFSHAGVFAAPMLARFLCDRATKTEQKYFDQRTGGLKRNSDLIADYLPHQGENTP